MKRFLIALVLSFVLGFLGLYLVGGKALFEAETYRPQNANILVVGVCVLALLAEWLLSAERIRLLCLSQYVAFPYRSALLVNILSVLGGVIIPGGAGQGPAVVAALGRLGLSAGQGLGVTMQIYVLDMIFFAWSTPLSLWYLIYSDTLVLPTDVKVFTLVAISFVLVGAVVLGRYPQLVVNLLLAVANWPLLRRFEIRLRKIAHDYYRSSRSYLSMPVSSWLKLHLATAANWLGGYMLLWGLLKLYGIDTSVLGTVALLNIITLASQFVPTPRGAGFVEATVGLSIGTSEGGSIAAALLVWRLLTVYISFLLGPLAGGLLLIAPRAKRIGPNTLQ
ncbi:MAG: flippase-like domain-containing protein [Rubrobacter sp.]|nr:flippase-like domain-containing protein [Rubrobacter sp.]